MDLTVRAEELGDELRRLREGAGLSLEVAGERIDASATKMSRIENGLREGATEDVSALLAVYGYTGPRRTELLTLAREVERRGWWQRNRPDFAERQRTLINLEAKADLIVNFAAMNIPGLYQTGEYTRALMTESGMVPENEVDSRMVSRLRRHSVLQRQKPPRLLTLIDELALHRMIGGPDVLRRQLDHLVEASRSPNITLRVVPNTMAHSGANGSFELIRRAGGHKVVFLENLTSSLFLEEAKEIETYEKAIRLLLTRALGREESVRLITQLTPEARTE